MRAAVDKMILKEVYVLLISTKETFCYPKHWLNGVEECDKKINILPPPKCSSYVRPDLITSKLPPRIETSHEKLRKKFWTSDSITPQSIPHHPDLKLLMKNFDIVTVIKIFKNSPVPTDCSKQKHGILLCHLSGVLFQFKC